MTGLRIFIICPYPPEESPSQRFRFEQYLGTLRQGGHRVSIHAFLNVSTWKILYQPGHVITKLLGTLTGFLNRWLLMFRIPSADFVFIHREAAPIGPPFFEFIIAKIFRKRIIYDFDDAIWIPNTSAENGIVSLLKWHSKVSSICRWSYKVSAGNRYLCEFASGAGALNAVLNPTTIDTEALHNPALHHSLKKDQKIIIGWTGTHSTTKYLDVIEHVLREIEEKFSDKIGFLFISNRSPNLGLKNFEFLPWSKESEIPDLMRIDIGIMPLTDDRWAMGKCGFKALQYMALGIPAVVSPIGVNTEIIDHRKDGFRCSSPEEWKTCLEELISDRSLRHQIGVAGRKKVETFYSVRSNTSNFLSLFE